jgi:hypothetical protein
MALPERYAGKPILLIIENYVMVVIGELPAEEATAVQNVVQRVWGGSPDWMSTVRRELAWETSFDEAILQNWEGYRKAARQQGAAASPSEFARLFADAVEEQSRGE